MNAMGIFGLLLGIIFLLMSLFYDPTAGATRKADSVAQNFILYRNAVNNYALNAKMAGSIPAALLTLPAGVKPQSWSNTIVAENGYLLCYVYGPATAETAEAARALMHESAAVGYAVGGFMLRNGPALQLPSFIPNGSLVSVIKLT